MGNPDSRLMVTLWPSFEHFPVFANEDRLSGIRLNSAMMALPDLDHELELVRQIRPSVPLFFDIKGRQLRVEDVHPNTNYLDITLNHPIEIADPDTTPISVLFKAGEDGVRLAKITEGGRRLIFDGGPRFMVRAGESLHIRHPSFRVLGPQFTDAELAKIEKVRKAGITRFFLSYVQSQADVDAFRELVGPDSEVMLKIEDEKGLNYVGYEFKPQRNTHLVAARGDLYVELQKPHQLMHALRLIIDRDKQAQVGSRILLSVVSLPLGELRRFVAAVDQGNLKDDMVVRALPGVLHQRVPSAADFLELSWLHDIGYRNFMLCDEICLHEDWLSTAVNAFDVFRQNYPQLQAA